MTAENVQRIKEYSKDEVIDSVWVTQVHVQPYKQDFKFSTCIDEFCECCQWWSCWDVHRLPHNHLKKVKWLSTSFYVYGDGKKPYTYYHPTPESRKYLREKCAPIIEYEREQMIACALAWINNSKKMNKKMISGARND